MVIRYNYTAMPWNHAIFFVIPIRKILCFTKHILFKATHKAFTITWFFTIEIGILSLIKNIIQPIYCTNYFKNVLTAFYSNFIYVHFNISKNDPEPIDWKSGSGYWLVLRDYVLGIIFGYHKSACPYRLETLLTNLSNY